MGKLIVLEGLDGSGKATQTGLLHKRLAEQGTNAQQVSFPDYGSDSSALVRMYLGGAFGQDPKEVNPYAASAFYAVDRYASYKTGWGGFYNTGGVVLADRYATSNFIHQTVKLPQSEWPGFVAWLQDFEYTKMGIPAPDVVVYLDVDPLVSQQLLGQRYQNDLSKKDIHESDMAYLAHCRSAALWCVEHLGWQRIVCSQNGEMRSLQQIADEVYEIAREYV